MGKDQTMIFMQGCEGCNRDLDTLPAAAQGCPCQNENENANEAHIYYETCETQKSVNIVSNCRQDENMGRVLDVTATLRNVCPGRCSAVGLTLTELDGGGREYARGFRAVSVPAHNGCRNQDIELETIRFVLPEDNSLQRRRHFILRTDHHYVDSSWN